MPLARADRLLTNDELKALAARELDCQVKELDLETMNHAYEEALASRDSSEDQMTAGVAGFLTGVGATIITILIIGSK